MIGRILRRGGTPADPPYPVCDDLGAWAEREPDAARWVLEPPFTTTRPMPASVDGSLDDAFEPLLRVDVPERALVRIPSARLRGRFGLVILPDDQFVGELVALTPEGRRRMLADEPAYRMTLPRRAVRMPGHYYAFLGFGVAHYYHWTHDLVMDARDIVDRLPSDARIIVPERLRPWQRETLSLLDLGDRELVPFPRDGYWEVEHLYVVTPRLKTQIDSPAPFRWFRDAVASRHGPLDRPPRRRLYLTRRHDNHWRTVNEPDVEELLGQFGFETVAPATLTFPEQVERFSDAEVIVGTGAGLFNMVFAPRSATVLQFQEPSHLVFALWTAAAALGLDYHYVVGETVPNVDHSDADLRMPTAALRAALQRVGLEPGDRR